MTGFLPYGRQAIAQDDIEAVTEVLRSDFLTTGPKVAEFEDALRAHVAAQYVRACSNGTTALHLASMVLGLGNTDAVVVPAVTFMATANAPAMTGADVIFSDVDPQSGLMRPEDLEDALIYARKAKKQVKAVFPVHLNGASVDMVGLHDIALKNNLAIVEDACHALGGAQHIGKDNLAPVGSCQLSDMACFSFHPVKTIAMGEGGAVCTNNPDYAKKIETLRSHGITRDPERFQNQSLAFSEDGVNHPWYHEMHALGHNFRIPDILCALGISQLSKLEEFVNKRAALVSHYEKTIADRGLPIAVVSKSRDHKVGWHLFAVQIDFNALGRSRADVMRAMQAESVGTQVHYIPVPWQPYWKERGIFGGLSGASQYYERCLSLPLYPSMTTQDVDYVLDVLARSLSL